MVGHNIMSSGIDIPEEHVVGMAINPYYKNFCSTERQKEIIDLLNKTGSRNKTADALGITSRTIYDHLRTIRLHASIALNCTMNEVDDYVNNISSKEALSGIAPDFDMTRRVPAPYRVKGVSPNLV